MNRIIMLFVSLIVFINLAIGQQKVLEIEVSDTINSTPDELVYVLTINGEDESQFSTLKNGNSITADQLKEIVEKHSEITLIEDDPNILRSDIYASLISNIIVKSKTNKSINALIEDLDEFTNISGNVVEMIVYDTRISEMKLKRKLLKLANIRASQTAQLVNKEIGEIISITEFEFTDQSKKANDENGSWTAYPPLSGLAHIFGVPNKVNDSKVYYQKMKITYELK